MKEDVLANWVARPSQTADFWTAMSQMRCCDIVLRTNAPNLIEEIPDLPDRIRGGLGRALERSTLVDASAVWKALFDTPPNIAGCNYVRGFLIRCDRRRNQLYITARLFGIMSNFYETVASALWETCKNGIALKSLGRQRRPLQPLDCRIYWRAGQRHEENGFGLRSGVWDTILQFETPFSLRGQLGKYLSGTNMANAITEKSRSIARWWGVDAVPFDHQNCTVRATEDVNLYPVNWVHRSARTSRHVSGQCGSICLAGINDEALSIFQLAELFHFGGGGASGMGRIKVIATPIGVQ